MGCKSDGVSCGGKIDMEIEPISCLRLKLEEAAGLTPDKIVHSYPSLNRKMVQAVIAYAAELGRERVVVISHIVAA